MVRVRCLPPNDSERLAHDRVPNDATSRRRRRDIDPRSLARSCLVSLRALWADYDEEENMEFTIEGDVEVSFSWSIPGRDQNLALVSTDAYARISRMLKVSTAHWGPNASSLALENHHVPEQ